MDANISLEAPFEPCNYKRKILNKKSRPSGIPTRLYFQDETPKTSHTLRYRNRSLESDKPHLISPQAHEFHTPTKRDGFSSVDMGTAGKKKYGRVSPKSGLDSGIDCSYASTPPNYLKLSTGRNNGSSLDTEAFESPLDYFQQKLYNQRPQALFNSDSTKFIKPAQILPVIVVLIIMASAVFTVLLFTSALDRNFSNTDRAVPRNGKYKSMEYAVNKYYERAKQNGQILPHELKNEDGEALGGKKAAIQYAFEVRKKRDAQDEEKVDIVNIQEEVENLLEAVEIMDETEVPEEVESLEPELEMQKNRQILLEKLRESGHFSTTKVKPDMAKDEKKKNRIQKKELKDIEVEAEVSEVVMEEDTKKDEVPNKKLAKKDENKVVAEATEKKYEVPKKKPDRKEENKKVVGPESVIKMVDRLPPQSPKDETPFGIQMTANQNVGFRGEATDEDDPFRFNR